MLLIHGVRVIIARIHRSTWVAALANKPARTIWAVLFHGRDHDSRILLKI